MPAADVVFGNAEGGCPPLPAYVLFVKELGEIDMVSMALADQR